MSRCRCGTSAWRYLVLEIMRLEVESFRKKSAWKSLIGVWKSSFQDFDHFKKKKVNYSWGSLIEKEYQVTPQGERNQTEVYRSVYT